MNSNYFSLFTKHTAEDTTSPDVMACPNDSSHVSGRHVTWTEPTVFDLSGNVIQYRSHPPGMFLTETTHVYYTFTDTSSNVAYCNFTIHVVCKYACNVTVARKCY